MRPYLLVAGDFVRTGGMDAANHALASWLARSGREVHLAAHRADGELLALPGVTLHRVPRPLGSHLLGFPLLDLAGRRVASSLAARRPIVVANGGNCAAGEAAWLHYVHAAYDPPSPTVSGDGRKGIARRAAEGWSRRRALRDERAAVRRARVVIANSRRTADDAAKLLGADATRVHAVYYGTDPERFRPPSPDERIEARAALGLAGDAPAVAFVGAPGDARKGFGVLLRAWGDLCRDGTWDATLLVAGASGDADRWRETARAAGAADRVRFLGFRDDVRAVLWACDALASPTRYEAYGLAVHEALCCGLPALVSADAGVAERYPPELADLLVHDPDDAVDLRERLLRWRGDVERYRAAALDLSTRLRARTWDDMAAEIVDLVERQE